MNHRVPHNAVFQDIVINSISIRLIIDGDVGANKNARGRFSDSVDTRLLSEIRNGKPTFGNGLIDSELSVLAPGGWAAYQQEFTAHN